MLRLARVLTVKESLKGKSSVQNLWSSRGMLTSVYLRCLEPTNSTVRHQHSRHILQINWRSEFKCHKRCLTWEWQISRWASKSRQTTTLQLTSTISTPRNLVSKAQSQGEINSRRKRIECRRIECQIMTLVEILSTTSLWQRITSMLTIWVKQRWPNRPEQRTVMMSESLTSCLERTKILTRRTLHPTQSRI